jgi:hypothetical protein
MWWCAPVISATREAEMGRITVPGLLGKKKKEFKVHETPISTEKSWAW